MPLLRDRMRRNAPLMCGWMLAWAASVAAASPPDLGACINIEADADRLACYDKQAGRAAMVALPVSPAAALPTEPAASSAAAATTSAAPAAPQSGGFLSRYWELDAADKRGTFNYTGYNPNYFLPLHLMQHVNQTPSSPSRGTIGCIQARSRFCRFISW